MHSYDYTHPLMVILLNVPLPSLISLYKYTSNEIGRNEGSSADKQTNKTKIISKQFQSNKGEMKKPSP